MKTSILSAIALAASLASVANAGPGLADGGAKFLGNITTNGQVRSDFGDYWNQITAENECKWGSIEGTRGNYDFTGCKRAYDWAKNNGAHFKFHALVWGSQYPNWLSGLDVEDTRKAIEDWFDAVQKEFPDLEMIDVVNEAIRNDDGSYHSGYNSTKIIPALGGDNNGDYAFIVTAFKMARDRWPDAILIYNDYNTIQWDRQKGIDLVNKIKKAGATVNAYGQQAHDISGMSKEKFEAALTEIHEKTGLPIYITEYDVGSNSDAYQETYYKAHIPFLWETEWIAGITLWGYITGSTWINVDAEKYNQCLANGGNWKSCEEAQENKCNGCSGLITNGKDRDAMTWLKEYFRDNLEKGQNNTGLGTSAEPILRQPFNGAAFVVPGSRIEAEKFDIPGTGIANKTFNDYDSDNHGFEKAKTAEDEEKCAFRKDDAPAVDLYAAATGIVVGYNSEGDWLEYTIDVKEAGDYTLYAAVSAAAKGASLQFSADGENISEVISVPAATSGEDNYGEYNKVKANVTFKKAGVQILRMTVVSTWFDIDYFNFEKGKDAPDSNPLDAVLSSSNSNAGSSSSTLENSSGSNTLSSGSSTQTLSSGSSTQVLSSGSTAPASSSPSGSNTPADSPEAIFSNLHLGSASTATYEVFDLRGQRIARFTARDMAEATQMWKNGLVKSGSNTKGIVLIHNRHSGETVQVKSIR